MSDAEVIPVIPIPRSRKARPSVWRDIGVAETDHVLKLTTVEDTKSFLMETFRMREDSDGRFLIVLDMLYYGVQFCKQNGFNCEKTSCFLSMLKQVHEMAIETPFGNIKETLEFLKDLILCHSVHRPPFSLGLFSPHEATEVSTYFIDTYFRHFKLYKYIFNPQVQLDLTIDYTMFPNTPNDSSKNSKSSMADGQQESSRSTQKSSDRNDREEATSKVQQDPEGKENTTTEQQNEADEPEDHFDEDFDSGLESVDILKRFIKERLAAETRRLRSDMASQVQRSDEAIVAKATEAANAEATAAGKKQSAKKKK